MGSGKRRVEAFVFDDLHYQKYASNASVSGIGESGTRVTFHRALPSDTGRPDASDAVHTHEGGPLWSSLRLTPSVGAAPCGGLCINQQYLRKGTVVEPAPAMLAWSARSELRGDTVEVTVRVANPQQYRLRAELAVVGDSFEQSQQLVRLLVALPADGTMQLNLAPGRGASEARVNDQPVPLLEAEMQPEAGDGGYFALLTLYDGSEVVAREPLFVFRQEGQQLVDFEAVPFTIEATSLAMLPQANRQILLSSVQSFDSGRASLEQAVLVRRMAWPGASAEAPFAAGDTLQVALAWHGLRSDPQPLMVSVQVLGQDDRKIAQWDGPLGGDWLAAQSWRAGERVRQDLPLVLAGDAPAGRYRVLLVVYDPATGIAQPISGQQALLLGELNIR